MKSLRSTIAVCLIGGISFAVASPAYAAEPWGACGVKTDAQKLVSNFKRSWAAPPGGAVPSGTTTFKCGTKGWGYRHLLRQGHDDEFRELGEEAGQNWRTVADKGMAKALSDPDTVTYNRSKATYCYSASINYYRDNEFVRSQIVAVIIGEGNWNIVSAYPSSKASARARGPDGPLRHAAEPRCDRDTAALRPLQSEGDSDGE